LLQGSSLPSAFLLDHAFSGGLESRLLLERDALMRTDPTRRSFLVQGFTGFSAAWVSLHWPAILSASGHAHRAMQSAPPPKFEFFTRDEAAEIQAITARILPTDDVPGALEAGVVYFIDRALTTFASADQNTYRESLAQLPARVRELLPGVEKFSAATPEQQDSVLHSLDANQDSGRRLFRGSASAGTFFETLRAHTIIAFLIDPVSGGNRDGAGWKAIGREPEHMFQPPFGYYDKDYPGWQPVAKDADKK
jgi:gluconate 2-dehydrogenase gamma chain